MSELSSASQAVLNAYIKASNFDPVAEARAYQYPQTKRIVAIIRAVADLIKLENPLGDTDADAGVFAAHHAICENILSIAAELEAYRDAD